MNPKETIRAAKAVALAQDVLAHLDSTNFRTGTYLSVQPSEANRSKWRGLLGRWEDLEVQEVEPLIRPDCQVCLVGALVLAKARVYDQLKLNSLFPEHLPTVDDEPRVPSYLTSNHNAIDMEISEYFDRNQRYMMENAFELTQIEAVDGPATARAVVAFGLEASLHAEDKTVEGERRARVKAVMENVVVNNGTFIPPAISEDEFDQKYEHVQELIFSEYDHEYAAYHEEYERDDDEEDDDELLDDDYEEDDDDDDDEEEEDTDLA